MVKQLTDRIYIYHVSKKKNNVVEIPTIFELT